MAANRVPYGLWFIWSACVWLAAGAAEARDRLTVHEWGTFTVLQDESGRALRGVNVNEERLPPFVHRLHRGLVPEDHPLGPLYGMRSKGIPVSYPLAIMRMETPIIYINPPDGATEPLSVDVSVRFNGGWISEWYPDAEVQAPRFEQKRRAIGKLESNTVGSIQWKNLTVGGDQDVPETDEHVWTAPRIVRAPVLTTPKGETEKYLFYRGVANIEAPLRVVRDSRAGRLHVQTSPSGAVTPNLRFDGVWLVDIRYDGAVAFRQIDAFVADLGAPSQTVASVAATFADADYSRVNLGRLRQSMYGALVAAGLYEEEADAMLNTWELSYSKSSGLRLFFTVPSEWTETVLPLDISTAAAVQRVMIGRIELVTPEHRALLARIADSPASNPSWFWKSLERFPPAERSKHYERLVRSETTLEELGLEVPVDYRAFMDLGRFREAIVLDALATTRQYQGVQNFTKNYRIRFVETE